MDSIIKILPLRKNRRTSCSSNNKYNEINSMLVSSKRRLYTCLYTCSEQSFFSVYVDFVMHGTLAGTVCYVDGASLDAVKSCVHKNLGTIIFMIPFIIHCILLSILPITGLRIYRDQLHKCRCFITDVRVYTLKGCISIARCYISPNTDHKHVTYHFQTYDI